MMRSLTELRYWAAVSPHFTTPHYGIDLVRQDFLGRQTARNRETAELSDTYQGHRDQVMKLIFASANDLTRSQDGQCSSLILLGAGNCLDVNLGELGKRFKKIHLVDVDSIAVTEAVQQSGVSEQCEIHAPQDIAEPLMSLTTRDFAEGPENSEHRIKVLQALTSEHGVAEVPPADVVVSLCVYSQTIHTLGHLISEDAEMYGHALKAVRMGHLRRLLSMVRPGGVAVFVSDVVSSDTCEELLTATPATTPDLVKKLVGQGNFFSGTNPALMIADLNLLTRLPGGPESVHSVDPWPWQMGDRAYAVYAFRIQKSLPVEDVEETIDVDDLPNSMS